MENKYTNTIPFKFSPVQGFSYQAKPKYAAGNLYYDDKGNCQIKCNSYDYCNYCELLGFLAENFECDYHYRKVKVEFYGKNTRTVKVGRTYVYVSAEDKISINGEYFLPDLMLALYLVNTYDILRPYGFNKTYVFRNKTNTEIADYFEIKFAAYAGTFKLPCDNESTKSDLHRQWLDYCHMVKEVSAQQFCSDILRADSSFWVQNEVEVLPHPMQYAKDNEGFLNKAIEEFNNYDDFCQAEGSDPKILFEKKEIWGTTQCRILSNNKIYCLKLNNDCFYVYCKNVGLNPSFINNKLETNTFAGKLGAIFIDKDGNRHLYGVHPDDYLYIKIHEIKKSSEDFIFRGRIEDKCTLSTYLKVLEKGTTQL